MKRLNLILTAALSMGLFAACDVDDDECNEAGMCPDAGDGEGGGGGEPEAPEPESPEPEGTVEYTMLRIADLDSDDDGAGTTGVDLCGVVANCANAISASAQIGDGEVCTAEGPGCSTDRSDPNAILDDGSMCEADSVPSHYISLGTNGNIDVIFDGNLSGCEITIVEFDGNTPEGWEAYVCDASGENCLGNAPVHTAAAGGTESFTVPAAAE